MGWDWEAFLFGLVKRGVIGNDYIDEHRLLDMENMVKYGRFEYFEIMIKLHEHDCKLQAENKKLKIGQAALDALLKW